MTQLVGSPKVAVAITTTAAGAHIAAIDGLRGFAAFSVLLFHIAYFGNWTTPLIDPLRLGYMGVELFFVLSGLCLALPYLRVGARPFVWRSYLQRRFRRIYPPYFLSVVLLIALYAGAGGKAWFVHSDFEPATVDLRTTLSALTFFAPKFNPPTWTLVIEARSYLAIPVLLYIQRRFGGLAALGTSLVVAVLTGLRPGPELGNGSILWRCAIYLPLFATGIYIAEWLTTGKIPAIFRYWSLGIVSGIAGAFWLHRGVWEFPPPSLGRSLLIGLLCSSAIVCILSKPWLRRVFEVRWLVGIGQFSYSLYLVHQPVIYLLKAAYPSPVGWLKAVWYFCVVAPLCTLFAYAFYLVAEKPFLRRQTQK